MKILFAFIATIFLMVEVVGQTISDTLETIVVTTERQPTTPFESPEAITVLNSNTLSSNVARSTAEALISFPGVWMQKTNHGGGSPFVRGLTGNQTLLLIDGIRLNNATYRYGPNQYFNTIDVLNINQIEVLRGAGAVLYGSDALGGTVQVLTKEGLFSEGGTEFHGSILGRILSGDMEQGGRAQLELSKERISILGGFSFRDFGELQAGGDLGEEAPSSYGEVAGDIKLKAKLGRNSIMTVAYNGVFQSEAGRFDQVTQRGYQTYMFDPQNRQLAYARFERENQSQLIQKIKLTAAYQNSLEGRVKQRQESTIVSNEEDEISTLSFIAETSSTFGKNWTAISGIEWYWDQVNSSKIDEDIASGSRSNSRGLYPNDSEAQNIALFTSHSFTFNKIKINAGARFNYFDINILDETFGNTSIQPTALVGNISALYKLHPQQAVTASINTGFRAPNINDLSSFGSFDSGIEVPTKELSPEKSLTFELGYKVKSEYISANLAVFRTQLFDLITRVESTFQASDSFEGEPVFTKDNTARANISGIELDGSYQIVPQISFYGNITYTYGQDEAKNEPLRRIPPLNGRLGLQFQKNQKFFTGLEWWFASNQDRLSGGDISDHRIPDGGTPGWSILNWRFGLQLNDLQINGGWQNIFDTAYRIHGSGVDGAGSHLWAAVKYSF